MARTSGRRFLLRVEDLDTARSDPAVAQRQIDDLVRLGLDFDPPRWVQSQRLSQYEAAIAALGADRVYECYCTRREIADAVRAPHQPPGAYPGTCAALSDAERTVRRRERPPALRIRTDRAEFTVTDHWQGEVSGTVDDFVLRRNDGTPAYNLAVVVDDAASGVDQVVRGADLLDSAPRQAWLADQLGAPVPAYAHVPLVLNRDGKRLAKRDGAVTLAELTAQGVSPSDVLSRIAISLDLARPRSAPVTAPDLASHFDPAQLPREPWVYEGEL